MSKALPGGWSWAKLPEIGHFGRGKSKHRPRNDPKLYGGQYPFIQTGDVSRAKGLISSHSQTYNETGLAQSQLWPAGTVCVTIAANIAESGILGYPACFPDSVVGLIPDKKKCVGEYVEYFIRTARARLADHAPSTAQKNINLGILNEVALPLPPVAEQRRIADILDKADAIRRKRQEAIALTESLLRSAFLEMFGDPVTNPKGWPIAPLSDCIESVEAGWSAKGEDHAAGGNESGVLKISAVTSGRFRPTENKTVAEIPTNRRLVVPKRGDLLFSRANTRELVAATCLVEDDTERLFLPDKLWRLGAKPERAVVEYLRYLLSNDRYRGSLTKKATGTSGSMLNVSRVKLLEMSTPVPPISIQQKFKKAVWQAYGVRQRHEEAADEASHLFDSLVQRAFRGELTAGVR